MIANFGRDETLSLNFSNIDNTYHKKLATSSAGHCVCIQFPYFIASF